MTRRMRPPLYELQKARLEQYSKAQVSFDSQRMNEYTAATGWHIDEYEQELPPEQPGIPETGGSFEAAQQVLRNYSFPPPDLITGIFLPDSPLQDRVMVLRARFLVFTFWFGVRVGGVVGEIRTLPDGENEAVWGYHYTTLEGHYEQGQIEFTVHKYLSTGRVVFKIHAVSKTGYIRNPLYRLGFRLFGRLLQRRFAFQSLARTNAQVEEMLRRNTSQPTEAGARVQVVEKKDVPQKVVEKTDAVPKDSDSNDSGETSAPQDPA